MTRLQLLSLLLELAGGTVFAVGMWMVYPAAGVIAAGAGLVVLGVGVEPLPAAVDDGEGS